MVENPSGHEGYKNIEELLEVAKKKAAELGSAECTTAHLLFAVDSDPTVQMGFLRHGVDRESLKRSYEFFFGRNKDNSTLHPDEIKTSPRVNLVLKELNTRYVERNRLPTALDLALQLINKDFEGHSQFVYQGAIDKPWERVRGNIFGRSVQRIKKPSNKRKVTP